jgi:cellulose synthase/poly-beta-1,6-N-acetylglucosamine synthase-like glycosyltransferase
MTFEVYQRRMGKVGFTLGAVAMTQDPDNFRDYVRQTKRWALGLWQTVRRHPPRMNLFSGMLALMLVELITSSVLLTLLPAVMLILLVPQLIPTAVLWPVYGAVFTMVSTHMTLKVIFLGIFVPEFVMTIVVAVIERRPRLLLAMPFFPFMRILDAAIGLYSIPLAWLASSNGKWKSPARHGPQRTRVPAAAAPSPVSAAMVADAPAAYTAGATAAALEAESPHVPG